MWGKKHSLSEDALHGNLGVKTKVGYIASHILANHYQSYK